MRFGKRRRRGATTLQPRIPPTPGQWKALWGAPLRWLGVLETQTDPAAKHRT